MPVLGEFCYLPTFFEEVWRLFSLRVVEREGERRVLKIGFLFWGRGRKGSMAQADEE